MGIGIRVHGGRVFLRNIYLKNLWYGVVLEKKATAIVSNLYYRNVKIPNVVKDLSKIITIVKYV